MSPILSAVEQNLLKDILVIFAVSIPLVVLLKRAHFPVMVGFLVAGALIGEHGLGLISDVRHINTMAELGLTLLLFTIGLEFSFDRFQKIRGEAVLYAVLQILLTGLAGLVLGYMFSWSFGLSLYFGCVLALSSSAVVMTILHSKRMTDTLNGQLITVILIIQDLVFIPMLVLLPLLQQSGSVSVGWKLALLDKVAAIGMLTAMTVAGRYLIPRILRAVSTQGKREVFVIVVMFLGIGASYITEHMGLSFALGSFMAGLLIGQTDYKYQALSEVAPFRYSFNSLFFVSIGLLVNLEFIRNNFGTIVLFLILIPWIKMLIISIIGLCLRFPLRLSLVTGFSLAQIGEFSFLLVQSGSDHQIIGAYLHDLIVASTVFGMMLTPLIMSKSQQIAYWIESHLSKIFRSLPKRTSEEHVEQGLDNHVIICGFGHLGQTLGKLLERHKIQYLVLELNARTVLRLKKNNTVAFFGDGASEEILEKSRIHCAKVIAITVPDYIDNIAIILQAKAMNPDIKIITRAKYKSDVDKLYLAGAHVVISEELEGGIEMGRYTLINAGIDLKEVEILLAKIRSYGSADFFA